ncbi:hypothetical protein GGX14DRAFT_667663 [Mycena pura]|uniref:Uncharacterized protein n=1 Tax=Mycena pura TaxID=153505 RepID=A0AAD6UYY9_9AGAR|nr:hypothetical protein GGX14DRAFT_667663 [Mycena pura]
MAITMPLLWTDFHFGPRSTLADISVFQQWLGYSGGLPLKVVIFQPPSRSEPTLNVSTILRTFVSNHVPQRLRSLFILSVEHHFLIIRTFLTTRDFPSMEFLSVQLESDHYKPFENHILTRQAENFRSIGLPIISTLHVCGLTPLIPLNRLLLREIVLGGIQSSASAGELKNTLESIPMLLRLGFYRSLPDLNISSSYQIRLPTLTSLSLRYLHSHAIQSVLSIFDMPQLNGFTLSYHHSIRHGPPEAPQDVLTSLRQPRIASRLRTLNLQSLEPSCMADFFQPFTDLDTLRIDFSDVFGVVDSSVWFSLLNYPAHLPSLRHLTLVNVYPTKAHELVSRRQNQAQPRLKLLQLRLPRRAAIEVEYRQGELVQYVGGLEQHVDELSIVPMEMKDVFQRQNELRFLRTRNSPINPATRLSFPKLGNERPQLEARNNCFAKVENAEWSSATGVKFRDVKGGITALGHDPHFHAGKGRKSFRKRRIPVRVAVSPKLSNLQHIALIFY